MRSVHPQPPTLAGRAPLLGRTRLRSGRGGLCPAHPHRRGPWRPRGTRRSTTSTGCSAPSESDPPRIWAGGPFSGRFGGEAGFADFHRLTSREELAWRTRIEGSRGIPERERLGPVIGLQERYAEGIADLGADFSEVAGEEQDERLRRHQAFTALLYEHACEGMYGAPEYGGNQGLVGWRNIDFAGDVQPRGYTDAEVSEP